MEEDLKDLEMTIKCFHKDKSAFDMYKKLTEEENKHIKEKMTILDLPEFETDNGLMAKMNVQNRESFNEPALIEKLLEIGAKEAIELVPTINWDKIEDMIYNGKLDASILAPYKQVKQVITLNVKEKKGE